MGRTRYVWLIGVLGWGLTMGICLPLVVAAVGSWLPVVPSWDQLPFLFTRSLIICPIGGYFFGLFTWAATEAQYEKSTRDDSDPDW
jgi:hypothetical protein